MVVNMFQFLEECIEPLSPVITVSAVLNGTASLPCDIRHPPKDEVILVVWYRNELKPIYSYDSRDSVFKSPFHWKDENRLRDRAYFRTITDPAILAINNVQETDEGNYRCRVDFMKSPTRNIKVFLNIIIPPEKPIILTNTGKELNSVAGPYEEGSVVKLICKVIGGNPAPAIRWWKNELLLESTELLVPTIAERNSHYKLRELILQNINRTDLHNSLTCQAFNNNINPPISSSVILDMYFNPTNVSIITTEQSMSVGREYQIICQTTGSRPPAKITWWKQGQLMDNYTEEVLDDGNMTLSTLSLRPAMKDHNKTLTCQASNPKLPRGILETILLIDVAFAPMLKLSLGSNMNPTDILEGNDVYFECNVKANPAAYKVEWLHNGIQLHYNAKERIIPSHKALVLQGVKKHMAGNYTCSASSVEGDGTSNTVQLLIKYKPICKANQKYLYGVVKEENAYVICEVDSYPLPDSFKWLFNHTSKPIPEGRYSSVDNRRGISILTFSPQTELDYGVLMCLASNSVGEQAEACTFHIIPAGQPEPPNNCTVHNQTTDSIEIFCKEGFDGGQSQYFLAEVVDLETEMIVSNMTSYRRLFKIKDLSPGKSLRMFIYSVNVRGKSEPVVMETYTLESAQKRTGSPSHIQFGSLVGALLGLVAVSCVLTAVVLGAIKSRCRRSNFNTPHINLIEKEKCFSNNGEITTMFEVAEKTPDVIQCNSTGSEYRTRRTDADTFITPADTEESVTILNGGICHNNISDNVGNISNILVTDNKLSPDHPGASSFANTRILKNDDKSILPKYTQNGKNCTVTSIPPLHREVITVRTPLLSNDQESCV